MKFSFLKKTIAVVVFAFLSINLFAAPATGMGGASASNNSERSSRELVLRVSQLSSNNYPSVKAYVTVENANGDMVAGINNNSWSATVDGIYSVQTSTFPFSASSEYINYNIIFSNSLVVGSGLINVQTQAILNLVSNIAAKDKISVYTMGDQAQPVCEDVLRDKFDFSVISTLEATNDRSRVYDSIADVLQKIAAKSDQRKVLIVISDEKDYTSVLSQRQFQDILERSNIPVYSIGVRRPSESVTIKLEEMSELSGGKYYYQPMTRELSSTLLKICDYINSAYIVNFKVNGLKADDLPHSLNITLGIRDSEGSSSKFFIATKKPWPVYLTILLIILGILLIAGVVILIIFLRKSARSKMGISRRCPDCGNLMKDSWDTCLFCLYMPELKNRKKKGFGGGFGAGKKALDKAKAAKGKIGK